MELIANVWPVVDAGTGVVLRYLARAYAMEGPDALMGSTLRALAPTDFRIAKVFTIPERFTIVSEHGLLKGCVLIGDFHRHQTAILEPAFVELEKSFSRLQGLARKVGNDAPVGIGLIPRFPAAPYLVITPLIEMPNGELIPQVGA